MEPNDESGRLPIDRQRRNKATTLRRTRARAEALQRAIEAAERLTPLDRSWYRLPELRRQLAETLRAIDRHSVDLAQLRDRRAAGETARVALSRRTSRYRRLRPAYESPTPERPNMADESPILADAIPASVEVAPTNDTPQPIALSRQQPPAPEAFTHAPTYPPGWEHVETLDDAGGIVLETVRIDGAVYRRRFNTATGDGELSPLF